MKIKEGYKQTEVGLIPSDWEIKILNSLFSVTVGKDLVKDKFSPFQDDKHSYPIYSNALTDTGIYGYSEGYQYAGNCITVTARGSIGAANFREGKFNAIGRLLILNPTDYCDCFFVSEFINHKVHFSIESTGVPQLTAPQISKYLIALPPTKAEQTAIATALSDVDALIQSLEKLIAKKHNIKQGAMQELLKPKEGWGEDKIKNLATITTGAKNTQDRIEDGQFPFFVRSQTVEKINSYSFDGEAVLTAGDGVGTGKIYHHINGKFDFHQRVYKISDFVDKLNGYYFYLYFSNNFFNRIMQMTAKSSVDSVRLEMIADMLIPLPSITEQTHIGAILSDMDTEITALETKLAKYKQIKQGMMQELLTGRTRLV